VCRLGKFESITSRENHYFLEKLKKQWEKQQRSKTLIVVWVGQRSVADYKKIEIKFIIQQPVTLKRKAWITYTDDILSRVLISNRVMLSGI